MPTTVQNTLLLAVLIALAGCVNDPSKRTPGTFIDDAVLEPLIKNEIFKSNPDFKGSHIVVVSYNGLILLAGQVATAELKEQAATVAQGVNRVRKVHNELSIGGPISLLARSNDTWLTAKVKSRLVGSPDAKGLKVKVVTENGVVYLMGLLTRAQADAVVNVTANVYGVQKIVKVFEYLD
ncbi:MAG: BON domain-containing protein [bacterium]